ncbi:synaptophysin-like protein 2 [Dysidea avara]|uniref:synaptophysin-like protein 2 n=1 Tax=Dysidea avara TaxID=196820 RepID=UPI00331AAD73
MLSGIKVSWRALVSVKAILRLVELVSALVAFSLTSAFKIETIVHCRASSSNKSIVYYKTDFPFDYLEAHHEGKLSRLDYDRDYGGMAQSFLAWGVISVMYCVVAICVYLLLSESHEWKHHEQTANIIYLADFFGSVLWMIVWLVVSVVWTIGSIQLEDFIKDNALCIDEEFISRDDDSFAQAIVAIGFGYVSMVLWMLSIWWTFKSSLIYDYLTGKMTTRKGGYEQIQ